MPYPFRNLVFEGGGVKGIAYVGALDVSREKKILKDIKRVGGTSAGAINAILVSLGYSMENTQDILMNLNFKNFMDDSWGKLRDTTRLIEKYGWYKGDFFRKWIGKRIAAKTGNPDSTFKDFADQNFKDLYIIGTNLSTGYSEVFSNEHTPDMKVADAARISMSITLFFAAVRSKIDDVYVDGGVFNNYPIKLFDRMKYIDKNNQDKHIRRPEYYQKENASKPANSSEYIYNKESLGFRLDTQQEIAIFRDGAEPKPEKIDDFFDYALALIKSIMNVQNNTHMHSDDWHRTVYINTLDVNTTDFDLNDEKKRALVTEGKKGIDYYFKWYDEAKADDMPKNHLKYTKMT
jgi:NTE family protein